MGNTQAYYADDIAKEMGLSREDLIALAFFLGSDYTEGVHGIGIVNAMEILQAFSMKESSGGPVEGLKKFRRWLEGYDFAQDILESFNKRKQQNATRPSAVTPKRTVRPKGTKKKKEKRVFALGEVEAFCSSDDEEEEEEVDDDDGTDGDHDTAVDTDAVSAEHQPPEMSETMTLQLIEQRMVRVRLSMMVSPPELLHAHTLCVFTDRIREETQKRPQQMDRATEFPRRNGREGVFPSPNESKR